MTPLEKAKSSKTFCVYPWMHQHVGPGGEIKVCCIHDPNGPGVSNLKNESLSDAWNNDKTKQIRLDMLNGNIIDTCKLCNNKAGISRTSREDGNDEWLKKIGSIIDTTLLDGTVPEHKLLYIDARFNNLCNFTCRTCTPYFSTSWHSDYLATLRPGQNIEYEKALIIPGNTESHLLEEILPHLEHVQKIYFAGGEPLMQEDHYIILEKLLDMNHVGTYDKPLEIYYSTNFSNLKLKKRNVLDYWKRFSKIGIGASIDGSYKKAEYWRKGTVWEDIVNNLELLKEQCPKVSFTVNYTLSWINAINLVELHREWVEKKYIYFNNFQINLLQAPIWYSLKSIPKFKKEKIEKVFLDHIEWIKSKNYITDKMTGRFKDAIAFMNSTSQDEFIMNSEFKYATDSLDRIRDENFWEVFPEHADMKEYIWI